MNFVEERSEWNLILERELLCFYLLLPITIVSIIVIILLVKWSKELETRRFTVFLYFLISTYIAPFYSRNTKDGIFELWFPFGFIIVFFYLLGSKRNHPSKMKASILGLSIALYNLVATMLGSLFAPVIVKLNFAIL